MILYSSSYNFAHPSGSLLSYLILLVCPKSSSFSCSISSALSTLLPIFASQTLKAGRDLQRGERSSEDRKEAGEAKIKLPLDEIGVLGGWGHLKVNHLRLM